jgi:hypothetical protein
MGGGASSYKMEVNPAKEDNAMPQNSIEWIAQGPTRLIVKADAFENIKPIGNLMFNLSFYPTIMVD